MANAVPPDDADVLAPLRRLVMHSITPFAYDANVHLVPTLTRCRQSPMLHVNEAQCLNGHITANPQCQLPT